MNKGRIKKTFIIGSIIATIFSIMTVVTVNMQNAKADNLTADEIATLKQNVLYKAVYSNLKACYQEMVSPINESSQNTWASFDSKTYFSDAAREKTFLKFPYDVGKKNQASCPGMITGWKTNWFIDLFAKEGSYSGLLAINKDAEVPGSGNDWYSASTNKMGKFLTNIGYTKKQDNASIDGKKCFYIKMTLNQSTYENYGLPPSAHGTQFETVDYCATVGSDGKIPISGDAISFLIGNNEYFNSDYDNGHLIDTSNIVFLYYSDGNLAPKYKKGNGDGAPKDLIDAKLYDYVELRYMVQVEATGGTTIYPATMYIQTISNKNQSTDDSYCHGLGYYKCGWWSKGTFSGTWIYASLSEPGASISYNDFKSRLTNVVKNVKSEDGYYLFSNVAAVDYGPKQTSYTKGSSDSKFISYFLKDTSKYDSGKMTDAEKYILYYTYLTEHYNVATSDDRIDEGILVSWLQDDGSFKKQYIYDPDADLSDKSYVLASGKWDGKTQEDWVWIAKQLGAIDVEKAFSVEVEDIRDEDLDDPDDDKDKGDAEDKEPSNEEICYKGAGSLGWIMCPVIMATSELADTIYDKVEKDYLYIQATSIFDESNGVAKVWATFRNLANILFVIFLTIVIFSQLTGFGIDNYGIKKMLPKLIITAILINFSYVLCQIVVDISNILGVGLRSFLEQGLNISSAPGASGFGVGASSVIWIVGVAAFFFANPAAVTTLFLLLISMVVVVLFLWLILIARQAGVVICIVISPIMLIFYMLPNTDKLFRKWVDIMKGLLLLYPICSLIVGGGKLAGAILSNVGDDTWKVAAMIVQVVPYFIIPSLLRGSINAINGLGDKLGNMGSRGQQRAFNKMYNSETMDRVRTGLNASNLFGRRDLADKVSRTKVGKVLGRPFYKSITRANQKKKNYLADDQKASDTMQQVMYEAAEQKDQKRIVRDRAKGIDTTTAAYQGNLTSTPNAILEQIRAANNNKDEERVNSLISEYQRRTSASKTAEMLAQFMDDEQGNGILGSAKRADFMRRLAENHASTLAKTPDLQQYLQTGGIDSNGQHIGFNNGADSYMQRNFNGHDDGFKIGDLKDSQVVGAGSGSIARMIASGQLTQPQAQRIMASKANREKMDDVQQLLLGAFSRNGAQLTKDEAETALKNHTGVGGFSADQITAMLEDGGDDVVIRDVRWRNQDGEHQQTDPLIVKHDQLDTSNSQPDSYKRYQEMVQRRVDSGDLTQQEANEFIRKARERIIQKQQNPPTA